MQLDAHTRRHVLVATTAVWLLAGSTAALAPAASARPMQEPAASATCPVGMDGIAARLRAAGLTPQAANVAAQLTYRDCLTRR